MAERFEIKALKDVTFGREIVNVRGLTTSTLATLQDVTFNGTTIDLQGKDVELIRVKTSGKANIGMCFDWTKVTGCEFGQETVCSGSWNAAARGVVNVPRSEVDVATKMHFYGTDFNFIGVDLKKVAGSPDDQKADLAARLKHLVYRPSKADGDLKDLGKPVTKADHALKLESLNPSMDEVMAAPVGARARKAVNALSPASLLNHAFRTKRVSKLAAAFRLRRCRRACIMLNNESDEVRAKARKTLLRLKDSEEANKAVRDCVRDIFKRRKPPTLHVEEMARVMTEMGAWDSTLASMKAKMELRGKLEAFMQPPGSNIHVGSLRACRWACKLLRYQNEALLRRARRILCHEPRRAAALEALNETFDKNLKREPRQIAQGIAKTLEQMESSEAMALAVFMGNRATRYTDHFFGAAITSACATIPMTSTITSILLLGIHEGNEEQIRKSCIYALRFSSSLEAVEALRRFALCGRNDSYEKEGLGYGRPALASLEHLLKYGTPEVKAFFESAEMKKDMKELRSGEEAEKRWKYQEDARRYGWGMCGGPCTTGGG